MATTISITVPDAVTTEFLSGFLRVWPVPLDALGQPTMTQAAWVKQCVKDYLTGQYKLGKMLLYQDASGGVQTTNLNLG